MITKKSIKKLEKELKNSLEGEVRFDSGSRALYATDSSNYRQIPIGLVLPKNKEDIIKTVNHCYKYKIPLLSRGGGTSLAGQTCNAAVIMDMSKYYDKILAIDAANQYAIVQPGVRHDQLSKAVKKFNLTFGPDPSTHQYCTLGGMIGNNSCGTHSQMAGKTDDNVLELEIITYDGIQMKVGPTPPDKLEEYIKEGGRKGEIYKKLKEFQQKYSALIEKKYPYIPRRVSGYSLTWLLEKNGFDIARALVGSESTLVTVLEAKVRLVYDPPVKSMVILAYPDIYSAGDHVKEIVKYEPIALEGLDDVLVTNMKEKKLHMKDLSLLPLGKGWLVAEFGGETKEEADDKAKKMMKHLRKEKDAPQMVLYDNPEREEKITDIRESGLGATARVPNQKDTWEGWEDSAVPPEHLGSYLRDLRALYEKYEYACALYGHFGQGCVHTRIDFDLLTTEGLNKYRRFIHEAADIVVKYGGSFSGEHGDGQSKAELWPKMFGDELVQAFREFKRIWDPEWKMNPGKMVDPYSPIQNIRLGPTYDPQPQVTHFQFPGDDKGSFARATLRCVGVGKCRRSEGGTMCPSYMATKEEMHSTRGRAHLLFEMLQGQVVGKKGWKDKHVKESLDLCLSCKGCKTECPMNVDMAAYKAEFLAHYYKGRLRPRAAYAFGLIMYWSRMATHLPKLTNFLTHAPGLKSIAKFMAEVPKERTIPKFANQNFKKWFFKRSSKKIEGKKVILWADTFNNYFHPNVAQAATLALEKMGFEVVVPKEALCCGRPLYDYGMLKKAKKFLLKIMHDLNDEIRAGTPIVGLEPSCVSVFRDEMGNLFPNLLDAKRLREQIFMLSEFVHKYAPNYPFKKLHKKAIVHGHCHHKTVIKFNQEKELLEKLGLDANILDSGCCGMAGSFGFEKKHYDVSMKCGERVLLPKVRETPAETLIITNGFSCHEQIVQATGKKPLHIAEVLLMAVS